VSDSGRAIKIQLTSGKILWLPRIIFPSIASSIKFNRRQVPLKFAFASSVHRAQGMTLNCVVIDMRSRMWEHSQLYVTMTRVRDPKNLCLYLPKSDEPDSEFIRFKAIKEVANLVVKIEDKIKEQYVEFLKLKAENTDPNIIVTPNILPVSVDISEIMDEIQIKDDIPDPSELPIQNEEEEENYKEILNDPKSVLNLYFGDDRPETNYFSTGLYFCFAFKEIRYKLYDESITKPFPKIFPLHQIFNAWIYHEMPSYDSLLQVYKEDDYQFTVESIINSIFNTFIEAFNSLNLELTINITKSIPNSTVTNWLEEKNFEKNNN
jgi:hypothetical protein